MAYVVPPEMALPCPARCGMLNVGCMGSKVQMINEPTAASSPLDRLYLFDYPSSSRSMNENITYDAACYYLASRLRITSPNMKLKIPTFDFGGVDSWTRDSMRLLLVTQKWRFCYCVGNTVAPIWPPKRELTTWKPHLRISSIVMLRFNT